LIIRFSEHALKRIKERGIDIEQAELVVKKPFGVIDVKFGRKACYRGFDGYFLVIIFEEQRSEIVIVTAVKVDNVRLKRYGFNRI
jgi:hypothetical protein